MADCSQCGADNPDRAKFCLNCGRALVATASPYERRRPATLLFCDVSGSTAMGERLDAEAVRELMFAYFHEMRDAIERHGGTVEKFVGDAVMAVFGVPEAHEDDPLRACRAAYEMQQRLPELNRELERRFGSTLVLRIGVNTGEVVAGDPSARETFVTGDAVNTAARLEQAAAPGEVLLGEWTYSIVRPSVQAERRPPIHAKGKAEPVPAYRLLSVPLGAPQRRRLQTPLVGRNRELAALRSSYEEAIATGRPTLALVIGEPGVGKSRLAEEFLGTVAASARVLSGRCLPYGEGITYWPLSEIVRSAVGIHDEHDRGHARRRIRAFVDDDVLAEALAIALGFQGGVASPEEIGWAARRLVESLASERPLVVHVDDLQWAEGSMLDLVAGIVERARGPIMVLALARPELTEDRPAWQPTIRLDPLDGSETVELARCLTSSEGAIRDRLAAASGGNPLFLEELSAMLAEVGLEGLEVPSTLGALLAARLDSLPEMERIAAERASIEGQVFHRGAVLALSDGDAAEIPNALRSLEEREFVLPSVADFVDEAAFRFRHLLIRDAAYRSLSKRLRAELHERFASWLERKVGDRLAEVEEVVGHHLEQAYRYRTELGPPDGLARSLAERAAARLAAAGARALVRSDVPAALSLLERASGLLPEASQVRPRVLADLGAAYCRAGKLDEGKRVLAEAIEGAEVAGDERLAASAKVELLIFRVLTAPEGVAEEALREAERLIPVFEGVGDDAALARLWHLKGFLIDGLACRWAALQEAEERSIEYARRAGDRGQEAESLVWLITGLAFGPTPAPEAIERLDEVLASREGNAATSAMALVQRAGLKGMLGEFGEGRRDIAEAIPVFEELGLSLHRAFFPEWIAGQLELLAEDPTAERHLRFGCERLEQLGERSWLSTIAASLAGALVVQRRDDEAERFIGVSREAAASDDIITHVLWRQARAKMLAHRGRYGEGEGLTREALALVEQTDMLNHHGACLMDLAEILELAGAHIDAASAVAQAAGLFERKGNVVMTDRARRHLAEIRA